MRYAFVLGCERSGSTWLANILDAHPEVELLMEPFADYAGLFPGVPGRTVRIARPDAARVRAIRTGMEDAAAHKHPLLYRRGRSTALEAVDRGIARTVARAARRLRVPEPLWVQRHRLLGLNADGIARPLRARKTRSPSLRVIKELRLNLASRLLVEAFAGAPVVAIVRHPVAQVASMARWIERGRLGELVRSLPDFRAALDAPGPLRDYAPLVEPPGGLAAVLTAYWVASYGTLLRDLRESGCEHLVLRHEALCAAPEARTREVLRLCGLPDAPAVARYVEASSRGGARKSDPLDTSRHSADAPARGLAAAPPDLRERVLAVLDTAAKENLLEPELARYLASG